MPTIRLFVLPAFLLAAILLPACSQAESKSTPSQTAAEKAASETRIPIPDHPLRGVITAVDAVASTWRVAHEDIPGLMPAMEMLFHVDAPTFKAFAKGQTITGILYEKSDALWLRTVKGAPAN